MTRTAFQFPDKPTEDHTGSVPSVEFSSGLNNLLVSQKENVHPGISRKESRNPFASGAFKKSSGNGAPTQVSRSGTGGLGSLRKRASAETISSATSTDRIVISRPGTANPYSRAFQPQTANMNVPVMAPAPQKAMLMSTAFGMHNPNLSNAPSSPIFKVPFASASNVSSGPNSQNQAHISTSDVQAGARIISDGYSQDNAAFRPSSRANGPQRVPIEQGPPLLNPSRQRRQSLNAEDAGSETRSGKRSRDDVEDEMSDYESGHHRKHVKGQEEYGSAHGSRTHALSPSSTGRPSSGMSHAAPLSEQQLYYGHPASLPQGPKRYSPYDAPPPPPASGALAKLIGMNPDVYVHDHMDKYDKMVQRFENCTVDEWRAGADELAADYHAILDRVKQYMDTKLKLYGDLHADMQAHNSVLQERKSALEGARKKLVNEGADVLK